MTDLFTFIACLIHATEFQETGNNKETTNYETSEMSNLEDTMRRHILTKTSDTHGQPSSYK